MKIIEMFKKFSKEWKKMLKDIKNINPNEETVKIRKYQDKKDNIAKYKYVLLIPWSICILCKLITYVFIFGFIVGIFFDLFGYQDYSNRTMKTLSYLYAYGPYSIITIIFYGTIFYFGIYGEKACRDLYKNSKKKH